MKYDWRITPVIIGGMVGTGFLRYAGFTWGVALTVAIGICFLAVVVEEAL